MIYSDNIEFITPFLELRCPPGYIKTFTSLVDRSNDTNQTNVILGDLGAIDFVLKVEGSFEIGNCAHFCYNITRCKAIRWSETHTTCSMVTSKNVDDTPLNAHIFCTKTGEQKQMFYLLQ